MSVIYLRPPAYHFLDVISKAFGAVFFFIMDMDIWSLSKIALRSYVGGLKCYVMMQAYSAYTCSLFFAETNRKDVLVYKGLDKSSPPVLYKRD